LLYDLHIFIEERRKIMIVTLLNQIL